MQNNWTINASFCASVEQTVVFQDKRSRFSKRSNAGAFGKVRCTLKRETRVQREGQEFCSTFFPVRHGQAGQPDGRKKVEKEKINLNLSLILNVLASTET
jgi:hypothetical protein